MSEKTGRKTPCQVRPPILEANEELAICAKRARQDQE